MNAAMVCFCFCVMSVALDPRMADGVRLSVGSRASLGHRVADVGASQLWTNAHLSSAGAVVIDFTESTLCVNDHDCFQRLNMSGFGPGWREFGGGIGGVFLPDGAAFETLYRNRLPKNMTIIHAHGMTPDSAAVDGLPYLSAPPIMPDREQLYRFPIHPFNTGTYFLHSHFGFHHDLGISVPLVVEGSAPDGYPLADALGSAEDVVVFLEDFCPYASDAGPSQNQDCFHPWEAYHTLEAKWKEEAPGFNFSQCEAASTNTDINYRWQLINERPASDPAVAIVDAGAWIRFRVISSTGMTNYRLTLDPALVSSDPVSGVVVAVDGQFVHPFAGLAGSPGAFWIAVAQRLDILVRAPTTAGAYTITAVAEGHTPGLQAVMVLVVGGEAHVPPAGTYPEQSAHAVGVMDMSEEKAYRAWFPLSDRPVDKHFTLDLTGDNGFKSINKHSYQLPPFGTFMPNPHPLVVDLGDRVCITYRNFNGDPHSMHLHGHSFQVVEIDGETFSGAVRDTVLVGRGECHTVKICFDAAHPGIWPLHCHMNYHLAAGMLTTVEYSSHGDPVFTPAPPPPGPSPSTPSGMVSTRKAVLIGVIVFLLLSMVVLGIVIVAQMLRKDADNRGHYTDLHADAPRARSPARVPLSEALDSH